MFLNFLQNLNLHKNKIIHFRNYFMGNTSGA